ncbi:Acyl-CoA dehydrogenase, C-terminal domain [Nocardia otitidiscaviarum]|uniref:Acyl-CoA dehydrogenase, C-terminal domain n=1 Tax=Nocardia otitidiscaviarum TaxID=1823 RepID=A0A379JLR5_9NOCA|nr:Acyl-CoA dehydrogenase, C-terminal domain [Nocardia otitidiscaviarum]
MTTTDLPVDGTFAEPPLRHTDSAATVAALQGVIFGEHIAMHTRVRDIVAGLADQPTSGLTFAQQAEHAPALLRAVIAGLGRPAREIAADAQLRGALCDWAQIAAPRLLLVLTGHFDLAIGAILALGNGSRYQQECLAELDTAEALGVLMLTELGGTNGADHQTTATWEPATGGFRLTTPAAEAIKFMPNVADVRVPKTVVVTARLIVGGRDEGVLPFLLKLRTREGLAEGVRVVRLPDKDSAPMDHALIKFDGVWLPREALLGGDWAQIDADGNFSCDLPPRSRFHRAISVLGNGRLDLANAAIASARAGLAGLVNYSRQRRPGSGTLMADRDAVQRDLATGLAAVYATSVLGRRLRDLRTDSTATAAEHALWSMLAKPLLSNTANDVLMMCRDRAAAQGALRINHLVDWIGNLAAIRTAEGENQIMQVTAGKQGRALTALQLPGTPTQLPWYVAMLADRERMIAAALSSGSHQAAGSALGRDSAAIELATATAERLAATAMATAAFTTADPTARKLAASAAAAYALGRIEAHGTWYTANRRLTPQYAAAITTELSRHLRVIAEQLPTLVAAFALPALPGPLFTGDYIQTWMDHVGWDAEQFAAVRTRARR